MAKTKPNNDVVCEATENELTTAQCKNAVAMLDLERDMIALACKLCKEVDEGKAKDYYRHIDAIISLYKAIANKGANGNVRSV